MRKNKLKAAGLGILLAASCMLAGCSNNSEKNEKTEISDTAGNSVVMTVGDTEVKYNEVRNYCYLLKCQYENSFGTKLWKYKISDTDTIGDEAKQEIINMITQLKVIGAVAKEQNISLTADEQDEAIRDAEQLIASASEKDKEEYFLSTQNLAQLYEDNIIANKMFYIATDEADTDISNNEAKQISIQYIQIITNGVDKNGIEINMDKAARAKALKRAKAIYKQAKKEADFRDFAEDNSDCENVELTCGKDTEEIEKTVVDAAFKLKKGRLSNVIEGKNGYYIVYCVNDYDEDATYARKEEIIEERQTDMFKEKYSAWLENNELSINSKFWKEFKI